MARKKTAQPESYMEPADRAMVILDFVVQDLWASALRFAFEQQGAPAACSRRACRKAGGCEVPVHTGKPVACGGCNDAAATEAAVAAAADLTMFASLMLMRTHYTPTHAGRRVGRRTPLIPYSEDPASGGAIN